MKRRRRRLVSTKAWLAALAIAAAVGAVRCDVNVELGVAPPADAGTDTANDAGAGG